MPPIVAAERQALEAIGRGAAEFRMTSRVSGRLLALGLISKARAGYSLTPNGRQTLTNSRRWQ